MSERLGSILHGAYGDYYEQMICLKAYKASNPHLALILFFANPARLREFRALDLGFADEIHLASELPGVRVDRFLQFQVRDPELQTEVLAALDPVLRGCIDDGINRKPWVYLRKLNLHASENQIPLSQEGRSRFPQIVEQEGLSLSLLESLPTVGFLWRYRRPGGAISHRFQVPEAAALETKSELLAQLNRTFGAHIIVAGMNVRTTEENRDRIDAKFTEQRLSLEDHCCTYLKGLSWPLELEILSACSLCIVMPSGFSEALWARRSAPTQLVDAPLLYILKAVRNRVPFFGLDEFAEILFELRQPHTLERVARRLERKGFLPIPRPTSASRA